MRYEKLNYEAAISALTMGMSQLEPDGKNCAICGDNDHQAFECSQNPLVLMEQSKQEHTQDVQDVDATYQVGIYAQRIIDRQDVWIKKLEDAIRACKESNDAGEEYKSPTTDSAQALCNLFKLV